MHVRSVYTSGTTVYASTTAGLFKSVAGGAFQPVAQGAEDDPKNPKKLNAPVQVVLQHHGRPDARGRRERRRVSLQRRRRDLDQARARQRHGRRGDGLEPGRVHPRRRVRRDQSGIYRSINAGATWTLSSDGISGTTLRVFADEKAPNIYYAAGHGGVFRTINAGVTWSSIDGPPGYTLPAGPVRAMQQMTGVDLTRLYVGTPSGVYVGTTDHGPLPGRGQVAQGDHEQQRPRRQHDHLGAQELPDDARARCSPARSPTAATR